MKLDRSDVLSVINARALTGKGTTLGYSTAEPSRSFTSKLLELWMHTFIYKGRIFLAWTEHVKYKFLIRRQRVFSFPATRVRVNFLVLTIYL